jgi:hypothetical protein
MGNEFSELPSHSAEYFGDTRDIQVYLNDKASVMLPPYETPEQRALAEEMRDLAARDLGAWSRPDSHRYFIAGGGREEEFDALWAAALAVRRSAATALAEGRYSNAGGALCYIVSGKKRGGAPAL